MVCENRREAKLRFDQDIRANVGDETIDSVRMHELTIDFKDGTVRRYFAAGQGPERVMGMEIHEYFNLVRNPGLARRWEEILHYRWQRHQPQEYVEVTLTNVKPRRMWDITVASAWIVVAITFLVTLLARIIIGLVWP